MSATKALVSVEEYLHTVYQPDCDYVDGEVLERNMAEGDHARLQTKLSSYLFLREKQWNITVLTEMRVQVKPERFRIPDICVALGNEYEQILTKPPFLCVEILSPDDRWSRVEARINDFLAMGVQFVWVLDYQNKQAFTATPAEGCAKLKTECLGQITRHSKFLSASSSLE